MNQFKQMIETVRSLGVRSLQNSSASREPYFEKLFWDSVEKCQPFVLADCKGEPAIDISTSEILDFPETLSPPFEIMSMEKLSGEPLHTDDIKTTISIKISCIMVVETMPDVFSLFCYGSVLREKSQAPVVLHFKKEATMSRGNSSEGYFCVADALLDRINSPSEEDGLEKVRERIKIGSGKSKKVITIRKVIHIRPKLKRDRGEAIESTRTIDYSHVFIRRGHWRDLPGGLGKNRAGDYCVKDKTWVNQSRPIGPKDKPLINKVRVVG